MRLHATMNVSLGECDNRCLLMFHGYGNDEREMTRIFDAVFDKESTTPGYVSFQAPFERAYMGGFYWYPDGCDTPTRQKNADYIAQGVHDFVSSALFDGRKIDIMGFSQGGYICMRILRKYPNLCDKAVLLSPSFQGEAHLEVIPTSTRIMLCYGSHDTTIPLKDQRDAYDRLRKTGQLTYTTYEHMGHAICDEEINDIREFLR